jgi:hypothetical protein
MTGDTTTYNGADTSGVAVFGATNAASSLPPFLGITFIIKANMATAEVTGQDTVTRNIAVSGSLTGGTTSLGTAGTDLNTLTVTGTWHQAGSANAAPALNYPVGLAGFLEVIAQPGTAAGQVLQRYTAYNIGNQSNAMNVWQRSLYGGVWTDWIQTYQNGPVPIPLNAAVVQSPEASYDPSFFVTKVGNVVEFSGFNCHFSKALTVNVTSGTIGTIPAGYRPSKSRYVPCVVGGSGSGNGVAGMVVVSTDGTLGVYRMPVAVAVGDWVMCGSSSWSPGN